MLLRIYTIWEMNVFIYSKWGPNLLNWWIIPFKIKNLQTKIYLAFFSDFEYLAPLLSYKIFIRISSEKTYCMLRSLTQSPGSLAHSLIPLTLTWDSGNSWISVHAENWADRIWNTLLPGFLLSFLFFLLFLLLFLLAFHWTWFPVPMTNRPFSGNYGKVKMAG